MCAATQCNAGEGLITYHRTDGVSLSQDAVTALRNTARSMYGERHVPEMPRVFKSKVRMAE
jgi:DNA topoisomerase I